MAILFPQKNKWWAILALRVRDAVLRSSAASASHASRGNRSNLRRWTAVIRTHGADLGDGTAKARGGWTEADGTIKQRLLGWRPSLLKENTTSTQVGVWLDECRQVVFIQLRGLSLKTTCLWIQRPNLNRQLGHYKSTHMLKQHFGQGILRLGVHLLSDDLAKAAKGR